METKYKNVDFGYEEFIYPNLWFRYHFFLSKYKNCKRMHLNAVKLYDRHFEFGDVETHPQSRIGMFIRACITAGYAKALKDNNIESTNKEFRK